MDVSRGNICRIGLLVFLLLLLCVPYAGCAVSGESKEDRDGSLSQIQAAEDGQIAVSFLGTAEDADCMIISSGKRAVMIDTGEEQDGERILAVLEEKGIEVIDYMILTHPDADHVGGADAVLRNFRVLQVVEPVYGGDAEKEERFEKLNGYCEENGIPVRRLKENLNVSTDYLDFTVYPPEKPYYEKANNYSLAVLVSHGSVHLFFAGDALRIRSEELLEIPLPEIDLYKVPHHGRDNKATEEMFEAIRPRYAVVTAGDAEEEVKKSCSKLGVQLFFTGQQGWEFISDGKELRINEKNG